MLFNFSKSSLVSFEAEVEFVELFDDIVKLVNLSNRPFSFRINSP